MVNPQNLVDLRTRTPEERKEIARLGGLTNKGTIRPDQWKCSACELKHCPKFENRSQNKDNPCIIPLIRKRLLESSANPELLLQSVLTDLVILEEQASNDFDKRGKIAKLKIELFRELKIIQPDIIDTERINKALLLVRLDTSLKYKPQETDCEKKLSEHLKNPDLCKLNSEFLERDLNKFESLLKKYSEEEKK